MGINSFVFSSTIRRCRYQFLDAGYRFRIEWSRNTRRYVHREDEFSNVGFEKASQIGRRTGSNRSRFNDKLSPCDSFHQLELQQTWLRKRNRNQQPRTVAFRSATGHPLILQLSLRKWKHCRREVPSRNEITVSVSVAYLNKIVYRIDRYYYVSFFSVLFFPSFFLFFVCFHFYFVSYFFPVRSDTVCICMPNSDR